MILEPTSIDELREAVRACRNVIPVGAETKPALTAVPEFYDRLSTIRLSGIVEYEPSEFTITVLAGTPLEEIKQTLAQQGQYLPFDPPLAKAGATIGGTVAAGLSGPGAFRFGPVRDFLIGVRFVDGEGRLITGGGKVVKNAAGFDVPKFLIGSCGRFGVLAELTFKVFPKPEDSLTFGIAPVDPPQAVELITVLSQKPYDLDALDYDPSGRVLWCRIAGNRDALPERYREIRHELSLKHPAVMQEVSDEAYYWNQQSEFTWATCGANLVKIPITPEQIGQVEERLSRAGVDRLYSFGGNSVWVCGTPKEIGRIRLGPFTGLLICSPESRPSIWLGKTPWRYRIHTELKASIDPGKKFPSLGGEIPP